MPAIGGTVISRVESIRPKPSCWVTVSIMPVVPPSPMTVATNFPAAAPPNKWPTKSMEISAMTPSKTLEKMVANPKYSHFWNSGAVLLNRRHKIKIGAKPTIYKRPSEYQTAFV